MPGSYMQRKGPGEINACTALYAVLGNPVSHSLSPVMHNAAFRQAGYNGVYVALKVTDPETAVSSLKALGIAGASVTIPFKTDVIAYLDRLDPVAAAIGAVNTIVNRDGCLTGYNTDGSGAVRALAARVPLKNTRVAVVGAGGAAHAVSYALIREGAHLVIANRSAARGELLAKRLAVDFVPLGDFGGGRYDVLINTTPVGMFPDMDAMPVDRAVLRPGMVVMDIVYNPLTTRLLRMARRIGCRAVNGVEMFVYQGAAQFEKWTRMPAPVEVMRSVVTTALQKQVSRHD